MNVATARVSPESLAVKIAKRSIAEVTELSVRAAADFCRTHVHRTRTGDRASDLKRNPRAAGISRQCRSGLSDLDRPAATLSGGEGQRIRLATQIGSGLVGVLYILTNRRSVCISATIGVCCTLLRLRDLGNTVIVVEHDAETMQAADYILDLGPGAGTHGGKIIAQGTPKQVMANPDSLTGQYLLGAQMVSLPARTRKPKGFLTVVGAKKHNLKG